MITNVGRTIMLALAIVLAAFISVYALSYFSFAQTGFLQSKDAAIASNLLWRLPFYAHIACGAAALLIGGFQFIARLRDRYPGLHRTAGKVYVLSVFVASVTSFAITPFAEGGIIAKTGFTALAIAWFFTNYKAYTSIKQGDVLRHRKWMIRNYALTFAAVTLRLWLPLEIMAAGLSFPEAYRIVAWLCWVPNLLVAEFLVFRLAPKPQTA